MADNGSNNKKIWIIAVVLLLLIINGVQFYLSRQDKKDIADKQESIEKKDNQIKVQTAKLDSLNHELDLKIAQVEQLGGDTTKLGQMRRELLAELKTARAARGGDLATIRRLNAKIKDFETMMTERDEEIEQLKSQNQQLFEETTRLKKNVAQREDSISRLSQRSNQQEQQLALAAILQAVNIKVHIIDHRGKEKEDDAAEFKARKIDKIKVSFKLTDNKVAKIETKEVFMRVLEPEGSCLYDLSTGGGRFSSADGKELYYTAKQSFLFDNKQQQLSFLWGKGARFKEGTHTIELYCEGHQIGTGSFTVK
ncbi:hypothetical protein [Flexibacter flexilis]|nr:hypothetical protein [Flexibacter flexilis]